jgi:hypothetical protein
MAGTGVASVPDYIAIRDLLTRAHALARTSKSFYTGKLLFPAYGKIGLVQSPLADLMR